MSLMELGQTSADARDDFADDWVKHYGWPELVIHDQGPEYVGPEFQTALAEAGVLTHPIDARSPWQQGRTERAGGAFKEDLEDVIRDAAITDVATSQIVVLTTA